MLPFQAPTDPASGISIYTSTDLVSIQRELAGIESELNRRRWLENPDQWAKERLGDTLWSGQRRILKSVAQNRRTAVPTCHEIGKSYSAGLCAGWWLDVHQVGEAMVVTTAPTAVQVAAILWKEIGRVHSRGALAGRMNQTSWVMEVINPKTGISKEETVAMGRKPSDYTPTAFQGIHAPYILVIVDEANGVRHLWEAFDSLIANDDGKLLAIGNPDIPSGEFFEACKPNSGYTVIQISAFDSPNFTGEPMPTNILKQLIGRTYVEEKRRKWAPTWRWNDAGTKCLPPEGADPTDTNPFWQSKVLGLFPRTAGAGSLIPLEWIRAAQARNLTPSEPNELGLDVGASEDGDPSCCCHRRGPVFRILYEERQPDTMKTCGRLLMNLRNKSIGATVAKVDYIGVGRGVVDRAKEENEPVVPIVVSEKATILRCKLCKEEWDSAHNGAEDACPKCGSKVIDAVFANLLSQLWWLVRGLFESGAIDLDPDDEQLVEELTTVQWSPNSKGQIKVEYASGPSPNRADALLIASAPVYEKQQTEEFVSW